MTDWEPKNGQNNPRANAVLNLVTSLDENDSKYLSGEIGHEAWSTVRDDINAKLAVVGLRLATVK